MMTTRRDEESHYYAPVFVYSVEFLYKISYPKPPNYIKSPIANLPQLFVLLFCACKNDAATIVLSM